MKIHEIITEVIELESAFAIRDFFYDRSSEDWYASAYDSDNRKITIILSPIGSDLYVYFQRDDRMDVTGWGQAGRVFATVVNAFKLYLQNNPRPSAVTFLARGPRRQTLYKRIIEKYSHELGYKLVSSSDGKFKLQDQKPSEESL